MAPGTRDPIRDRVVELRRVPAAELRANPKNWRRHPRGQVRALTSVLQQVGYADALLARETPEGLELIDGHLRAEITPEQEVPVLVLDVDQEEADLILATLDPLAAMAEADSEALEALLSSVAIDSADLAEYLAGQTGNGKKEGLTDPDEVPEVPTEPTTKAGDLWLLGEHRLLCGDAMDAAAHERLLGDVKVDLVLTDPPYGVGVEYGSSKTTVEDDRSLIQHIAERCVPLLRRWPVVLMTPGRSNLWVYPEPSWLLGWFEPAGVGRGPWGFSCWQVILAYGQDPYLARGLGARPDAWVGSGEGASSHEHPVAKPMGIWRWLLERGSPATDEVVLDVFVGSGTTIIAAEELNRRCYGMDIDPHYCDVAVRRWENFTGKTAELAT